MRCCHLAVSCMFLRQGSSEGEPGGPGEGMGGKLPHPPNPRKTNQNLSKIILWRTLTLKAGLIISMLDTKGRFETKRIKPGIYFKTIPNGHFKPASGFIFWFQSSLMMRPAQSLRPIQFRPISKALRPLRCPWKPFKKHLKCLKKRHRSAFKLPLNQVFDGPFIGLSKPFKHLFKGP